MEIQVLEEKNNKLIFDVDEDVGFVNAIKNELWEDEHVKVATYYVNHPLVRKTKVIVETDGADPKKAIVNAVARLQKLNEKFSSEVKKEIK